MKINSRRTLAVFALVLLVLTVAVLAARGGHRVTDGLGVTAEVSPGKPTPSVLTEPCHEEDKCWNCLTMGNKVCGPQYLPLYERIDVTVTLSLLPGSSAHTRDAECRVAEVPYGNLRYLVVCDDGWMVRL